MTGKTKRLLLGTVALAALAAAGSSVVRADDNVLYINSSGGVLDDINRKVHWDTFTAATGIKVVASAPVDNAKLKAMQQAWIAYRDTTCNFYMDKIQGSIAQPMGAACATRETARRALLLRFFDQL